MWSIKHPVLCPNCLPLNYAHNPILSPAQPGLTASPQSVFSLSVNPNQPLQSKTMPGVLIPVELTAGTTFSDNIWIHFFFSVKHKTLPEWPSKAQNGRTFQNMNKQKSINLLHGYSWLFILPLRGVCVGPTKAGLTT